MECLFYKHYILNSPTNEVSLAVFTLGQIISSACAVFFSLPQRFKPHQVTAVGIIVPRKYL